MTTEPANAPKSDCEQVLSILRAWKGDWVPRPYAVMGVMWHSRVADLRKRGYKIECKRFPEAKNDYRYRLVEEARP